MRAGKLNPTRLPGPNIALNKDIQAKQHCRFGPEQHRRAMAVNRDVSEGSLQSPQRKCSCSAEGCSGLCERPTTHERFPRCLHL
ncbi:helicase required for RNAi-mediated heterochromatin assembly 1 [Histoplasma capsulatum]|uniref:Helicase required for RNAi-mediated heterochromatin assembly 1 n=1 Tax=Ajellomyces capsulatus TaxID=5037 RepID=A0A8A1M140_AJECA|nr:helicase required for RNAi-mediated heterochromatin assembly 1 [Histoplasma capsulatum]